MSSPKKKREGYLSLLIVILARRRHRSCRHRAVESQRRGQNFRHSVSGEWQAKATLAPRFSRGKTLVSSTGPSHKVLRKLDFEPGTTK